MTLELGWLASKFQSELQLFKDFYELVKFALDVWIYLFFTVSSHYVRQAKHLSRYHKQRRFFFVLLL